MPYENPFWAAFLDGMTANSAFATPPQLVFEPEFLDPEYHWLRVGIALAQAGLVWQPNHDGGKLGDTTTGAAPGRIAA